MPDVDEPNQPDLMLRDDIQIPPEFNDPNYSQLYPQSSHGIEDNYFVDANFQVNNVDKSIDILEFESIFPPGYLFIPTDEELIINYLEPKIKKQEVPQCHIRDDNIYRDSPDKITEGVPLLFGHKEWYFFSPRNRKYPNGDRPNRRAGNGYWKATGTDTTILDRASKKGLVFHEGKSPNSVKTTWMMQEYCYIDPKKSNESPKKKRMCNNDMRLDEVVLYKIYKNDDDAFTKKQQGAGRDHHNSNENSSMHQGTDDHISNSSGLLNVNEQNHRPSSSHHRGHSVPPRNYSEVLGMPQNDVVRPMINSLDPGPSSAYYHGHYVQHKNYSERFGMPPMINCVAENGYSGPYEGFRMPLMINCLAENGSSGPYETIQVSYNTGDQMATNSLQVSYNTGIKWLQTP